MKKYGIINKILSYMQKCEPDPGIYVAVKFTDDSIKRIKKWLK